MAGSFMKKIMNCSYRIHLKKACFFPVNRETLRLPSTSRGSQAWTGKAIRFKVYSLLPGFRRFLCHDYRWLIEQLIEFLWGEGLYYFGNRGCFQVFVLPLFYGVIQIIFHIPPG